MVASTYAAAAAAAAGLALLATSANAQIPAGLSLPACVLTCTLANAGNSSCGGVGNLTCLCTDVNFQSNVTACYGFTCNSTDFIAALLYGNTTCAANGTPINITAELNMTMFNQTNGTNITMSPSAIPATTALDMSSATASAASTMAPARRSVAARAREVIKRQTNAADRGSKLALASLATAVVAGVVAVAL